MNPYTKLLEIDENANEFGTLFKSQVKLEPLLFSYSRVSTSVGLVLETAPDPHQVSGWFLRLIAMVVTKSNRYPFLIYNHSPQIH
jgi:hypothetical protein